jgi:replicative DNA helicase
MQDRGRFYSEEAECAVLGCILLDNEKLAVAEEALNMIPLPFHNIQNATIFTAMKELAAYNTLIELVTVVSYLSSKNLLQKAGGPQRISSFMEVVPSPESVTYYLEIMVECSRWRMLSSIGQALHVSQLGSTDRGVDDVINVVRQGVSQLEALTGGKYDLKDQCKKAFSNVEKTYACKGISGMSTGFNRLDKMIDGLNETEMVVVAARPSVGKTAITMNIAEHIAVNLGIPTAVFSLEMSPEALIERMGYSRSKVSRNKVRQAAVSQNEILNIGKAFNEIMNSKLHIEGAIFGGSIASLRSKAINLSRTIKPKVIIIDYIQLLTAGKSGRTEDITSVSNTIKHIAVETGSCVIAISQLNRDIEKDKGREPRLSDLRDSGSIEQDADKIIFLHPNSNDGEDQRFAVNPMIDAIVAKQRNGPTGKVPFVLNKEITRFKEEPIVRDEDIP